MQKTINDIKKEFNEKLLIIGNKFYFYFLLICLILFCFNIYFIYNNTPSLINITIKILLFEIFFLISTLIIDITSKWKSSFVKYISVTTLIIFENILLYIYKDADVIMLIICNISITTIYLNAFFTGYVGVISTISFFIIMLINYLYIEGRTLTYSAWLYYSPITLSIILTIFFTIFCKTIKHNMLKERINEFEIEKAKRENALASKIQEGFLNHDFPSNEFYDINACMIPSKEVGGDFYDFYMIDKSKLVLLIADVSGKGVPAALLMANAKTVIKNYITYSISFEKSIETANRDIIRENKELQFITMFVCIIDLLNGKMNYINAGHVKPFVIDKSGNVFNIISKPDFIFGVRKDSRYHSNEYTLNPGDKLFLCTDGVTERLNINDELYGKDRLKKVLSINSKNSSSEIITSILNSLDKFSNKREQNDDITCLLFNYKKHLILEPVISKDFDISKEKTSNIISYITEVLKSKNIPEKIINLIAVASDEIISNTSKYAYEDMTKENIITIQIQTYEHIINVTYIDSGKYFNPLNIISFSGTTKVTDKSKIGGLGIQLTWNIMDNVTYNRIEDKNVILIEKEF